MTINCLYLSVMRYQQFLPWQKTFQKFATFGKWRFDFEHFLLENYSKY